MEKKSSACRLVREFARRGQTLATAESCTGGLIAKSVTDVSGSSAVLLGGFVTYTNESKIALLGVDPAIIARESEVSHACARAMAQGARAQLGSDFAISTTGYAGPTGGSADDPVGTVYIGIATPTGTFSERFSAPEGVTRAGVRRAATDRAIALLWTYGAKMK